MEVVLVGIIGWAENNLEIINCANLNTISGSSNSTGGIIGMCENVIGGIYNSYNIGELCTNGARTGGVVGSANSDIDVLSKVSFVEFGLILFNTKKYLESYS